MTRLLHEANETVLVFPQETWIDEDGNTNIRPATEGVETPAMIRVAAQSGTASRLAEQMDEGWFTEKVYWVRFPRGSAGEDLANQELIGPASRIEWNGEDWRVFGHPTWFNGSSRTRRFEFTVRRN